MEKLVNILGEVVFTFIVGYVIFDTISFIFKIVFGVKRASKVNKPFISKGMTVDKACKILGIKQQEFNKLTKDELKSIFRKRAKETHPDRGGSSEAFCNVNEAFQFASAL